MSPAEGEPLLRVIRGEATPEEVAALVAAIAAVRARAEASAAGATRVHPRSLWALPARNVRPPLGHGPGAWRASGFPR